jgi:hypothetical protein
LPRKTTMKYIGKMRKYFLAVFLMLAWPITVAYSVKAAVPNPLNEVIFSEIFPGNPSPNAGQEFIELYNNTNDAIDLAGWHVQYTSATKTDWSSPSRNITLSGVVNAGDYYLLASTGYLTDKSNLSYSAALSQTGGHLRILDNNRNLQDQIGWGNAAIPLGFAVPAPDPGTSIARDTSSEGFNLTLDNSTDFAGSLTPTPKADNVITVPAAEPDPNQDSSDPSVASTPPATTEYATIQISELLPNPASPQTDDQDEYVELYNPNNFDVDLTGYIITTGANSTYKHNIKGVTIEAGGYSVFYSRDTNLTLSNTAGKATLLDPSGKLLDETEVYSEAAPGVAWIFNQNHWGWSATPTPGTDNIFTPAVITSLKLAKAKTSKTTKAKATAKKAPKVKAAKTSKPKKTKKTPAAGTHSSLPKQPAKIHPAVLAGVGSAAVLYGLYEYRADVANSIYRFRRYRAAGGITRPAFITAAADRTARRFGRRKDHLRTWLGARLGQ